MPSTLSSILLSFLSVGSAAAAATVYLAGDSTMAKGGGGSNTDGWGQYLQYSFSSSAYVVSNKAIGGRSARSFTREGRFQAIADIVKAGDWVVVEFGHNDGGSLTPTDNGRTDCFGDGAQTCQTVSEMGAREERGWCE
jgi:rhamnogalacturonan acetylesterase